MTTGIPEIISPVQSILSGMITSFAQGFPKLIAALLILLVGWVIAVIVSKLVDQILRQLKIDKWIKERGLQRALFGVSIEQSAVIAVKWYIAFLFIQEAALKMDLIALAGFFGAIIAAVPEILVGVATIALSLILGSWLREQILSTKVGFSELLGGLAYGFVVYMGIVLALPKFGFTQTAILLEAFRLFVGGLAVGTAIALGVGFGLAIKEGPAKAMLGQFSRGFSRKR